MLLAVGLFPVVAGAGRLLVEGGNDRPDPPPTRCRTRRGSVPAGLPVESTRRLPAGSGEVVR